jgi:hypothetical protein
MFDTGHVRAARRQSSRPHAWWLVSNRVLPRDPKMASAPDGPSALVLIEMAEKLAPVVLPGAAAGLCGQLLRI